MHTDGEIKKVFTLEVEENIIIITLLEFLPDSEDEKRFGMLLYEDISSVLSQHPGKVFHTLVNLAQIAEYDTGLRGLLSEDSRARYEKLITHPQMGKVALVAKGTFYRLMMYFMAKASGKTSRIGFFETKEEALRWLKK